MKQKSLFKLSNAKISVSWEIVLAFFLGGAISSLAQDPSDTVFFYAQANNILTGSNSVIFWYLVPFLLYISLFVSGYLLAKYHVASPMFLLYFYAFLVVISGVVSISLPQSSSWLYVGVVLLGTIVSIGVIYGLNNDVKKIRKH